MPAAPVSILASLSGASARAAGCGEGRPAERHVSARIVSAQMMAASGGDLSPHLGPTEAANGSWPS